MSTPGDSSAQFHPTKTPTFTLVPSIHPTRRTEQLKRVVMPFTIEVESPVPAARMYKAALVDWHNLGPKIAPHVLSSGSIIEGDGSVGSIRQLNFTSDMPFSYVKERLDFVDNEKFECKVTVLEGGHLETILESASVHFKIEPTSTGGCICKVVTESKFKPGAEAGEEEAKAKEYLVKHFKATEAYLLANPDAYV